MGHLAGTLTSRSLAIMMKPRRSDLAGPAVEVAPTLLGAFITHRATTGVVSVRITEVEAYEGVGNDPASHAHRGRTSRNAAMFAEPGTLYVYFVYGMHWCANVVCGREGEASAVLLRAGEVVRGDVLARQRRTAARRNAELARGPANFAASLGIAGPANGADLIAEDSVLQLSLSTAGRLDPDEIGSGPRVGISQAADRPWRWWIKNDPTVSRYRGLVGDTPR
jgi:DNA-3-methyladenine glycosylase